MGEDFSSPSNDTDAISGLIWYHVAGASSHRNETYTKKSATKPVGQSHLIKIGLMGVVGTFDAADFRIYTRDQRVICRTGRGLEIGVVICDVDTPATQGDVLRVTGSEDELILDRLERFRDRAYKACNDLLVQRGLPGTLVDVEHLFDGESVFFYFLGEVDPRVESLTGELAEAYDRKVKFKQFAQALAQGCGPDCGTKDSGCSTGGCGSCALSGGCGSKKNPEPSHQTS